MTSQILPADREEPPPAAGLRELNPFSDLGQIARVIEVAFAEELSQGEYGITRELRNWNRVRPLLWLLSQMVPATREAFSGYVWEEAGRVVGNISVTRSDSTGIQWIISNVAVLPEYRRRGIARALLVAALEHVRRRGAHRVVLNVASNNVAARELYERAGFRLVESVTELRADRVARVTLEESPGLRVIEPVPSRWREAFDVARAATPLRLQQLRPLRPQQYRLLEPTWLDRFRRRLVYPRRERWWVEFEGRVVALLTIDHGRDPRGRELELVIPPDRRGLVEGALVNQVARRLAGSRHVRASLRAELTEARHAIALAGFRELRTLDQMVREIQ